jgi:hypothetical protein
MIFVQDIRPGMRFLYNSQEYRATAVEYKHGYTGKYLITAVGTSGRLVKITLWAGETVAPVDLDSAVQ